MKNRLQGHILKRSVLVLWVLIVAVALVATNPAATGASGQSAPAAPASFVEFETGQVRPIAMSPDGTRLFAVNTPNDTLDIFNITATGLSLQTRVPVGLEPVAVAARNNNEVWVVNHLSDSVSVVMLGGIPHVTSTLLVGDEPRDIVFAGSPARAFITTAHRGQQRTSAALAGVPGVGDPQLTTAGVGRADVWVFDPANLGAALGGLPVAIVTLFGDTPRALAVTPDGKTVYAAVFKSGNQTTSTPALLTCSGFDVSTPCTVDGTTVPGSAIGPATNHAGLAAPRIGLILKADE